MTPQVHRLSGRIAAGGRDERGMLIGALMLAAISVVGFLLIFLSFVDLPFEIERPYLIPWVIATGLVVCAPSAYLWFKGEFSFVHPLVYPVATYFFPIFFLGGWSLVFGLSNFYYLSFINDPETDFPLTFLYVIAGFGFLSIGFFMPQARRLGSYISRRIPKGEFTPKELVAGSFLFLLFGFYATLIALEMGQIGYQIEGMLIGDFGSLNSYLTLSIPTSSFLLWVAFFRIEKWNTLRIMIVVAQVVTAAFMLLVLGGKSSLLQSLVYFVGAMVLVKRIIPLRTWGFISLALFTALAAGILYGTTFRELKGTDRRISADQYMDIAVDALTSVGDKGTVAQMQESFFILAERLEIASSLAVVVSNYEALAPYEAAYGLENNIWNYTWTAFIPRFLWPDKPMISDGYSYNELYFGYGGFGLAITAMGDLLRNYGPIGIPIGMFVLGFAVRIFYAALVEGQPFYAGRAAVYFIVLIKLSYDSFYGDIFPATLRVTVVVVAQLVIMKLLVRFFRFSRG